MVHPVSNSLTFVFTAAASHALGERPLGIRSAAGSVLVLAGVALSVWSKEAAPASL